MMRKRAPAHVTPFQLSLHVRHPSVDPDEISRELGLEATESFRAGEPRHSRSGVAATAVHGETYWVAVLDPMVWSAPATLARRRSYLPGGQSPAKDSALTDPLLEALQPQEAKMLRARFGLEEGEVMTPGSLGWGIVLVCHCMTVRYGRFLARLREQGGSLTLLAAVEPEALMDLRITPEMGRQLHELGLTVKIEVAGSADFNLDLN
ncbi:MAG TPA: hypothetical protein VK700_08650 [Steroidobacteraceae bacterium]|jgi:hypothetical protein|nr:hypothetical protein [Steroidobacteraceae bacterium]